jgi:hypothetical protein
LGGEPRRQGLLQVLGITIGEVWHGVTVERLTLGAPTLRGA